MTAQHEFEIVPNVSEGREASVIDACVAAMRRNGQPVTYVVFEDEGHGFARPENNKRFNAAVEAFLAEHLGGRAQPPGPDEAIEPYLR